jgi:hypothetical protein
VTPSVRRVYLDTTHHNTLQEKLTKAEAKIQKMEADQETLMKRCEHHMAAAQAHAAGEAEARKATEQLCSTIDSLESERVAERNRLTANIKSVERHSEGWRRDCVDLRARCCVLEAR